MAFGFKPNVTQAITNSAQQYGIDPQAMMAIAQIESRGNPNAKNPRSSAAGLFQFINSTAKQYGLSNPYDLNASADAGARLARDNSAILSKTLGRAPNVGELYLAHQQGAGGARKLLANPNARAVDIVGAQAVKLNGGTANMSAQEFANIWINKAMKTAGQAPSAASLMKQGVDPGLAMAAAEKTQQTSAPSYADAAPEQGTEQRQRTQGERLSMRGASLIALDSGEPLPMPMPYSQPPKMDHVMGRMGPLAGLSKKGFTL